MSDNGAFCIWDRALMCVIILAHEKVLDFDFDLVNWYLDAINQQLIYELGTETTASEYTEDSD